MPSLTSPIVQGISIEESVLTCFREYFALWFDGQAHSLTAPDGSAILQPTVFPVAELHFGVAQSSQPLGDKLGIQGVWIQYGPKRLDAIGTQRSTTATKVVRHITIQATWHFFVRAGTSGTAKAEERVMQGASLLHYLLEEPAASVLLAQNGIHHLRPNHPIIVSASDYATRLVTCRGKASYNE